MTTVSYQYPSHRVLWPIQSTGTGLRISKDSNRFFNSTDDNHLKYLELNRTGGDLELEFTKVKEKLRECRPNLEKTEEYLMSSFDALKERVCRDIDQRKSELISSLREMHQGINGELERRQKRVGLLEQWATQTIKEDKTIDRFGPANIEGRSIGKYIGDFEAISLQSDLKSKTLKQISEELERVLTDKQLEQIKLLAKPEVAYINTLELSNSVKEIGSRMAQLVCQFLSSHRILTITGTQWSDSILPQTEVHKYVEQVIPICNSTVGQAQKQLKGFEGTIARLALSTDVELDHSAEIRTGSIETIANRRLQPAAPYGTIRNLSHLTLKNQGSFFQAPFSLKHSRPSAVKFYCTQTRPAQPVDQVNQDAVSKFSQTRKQSNTQNDQLMYLPFSPESLSLTSSTSFSGPNHIVSKLGAY